jgi:hypothetical protein
MSEQEKKIRRAYNIVNGIGGICATEEEAKDSLNLLNKVEKNLILTQKPKEWVKFRTSYGWVEFEAKEEKHHGKETNINRIE